MTEPHFKIGGKTSPGRFSRHFYNLYPNNTGKEDERSDCRNYSVPNFYLNSSPQETRSLMMRSTSTQSNNRHTLSPVREHPAVLVTVITLIFWVLIFGPKKTKDKNSSTSIDSKTEIIVYEFCHVS